jgi:hypothetical protein
MIVVPGSAISLPAVQITKAQTSAFNAWGPFGYASVRLTEPMTVLRVHVRAGTAVSTSSNLAWGAGSWGRWLAIGDGIHTREEYQTLHALPGGFSHQDEWTLPASTILNVGIAGPLFGHRGGAPQGEWLSGPTPIRAPLAGFWSSRAGRA